MFHPLLWDGRWFSTRMYFSQSAGVTLSHYKLVMLRSPSRYIRTWRRILRTTKNSIRLYYICFKHTKTFLLLIPHPDHVRLLMSAESRLASVLNFIIALQAISWELFPDLPVSCLLNKLHSAPALSCLAPQTPIPVDQNQAQKRSAGHATRKIW